MLFSLFTSPQITGGLRSDELWIGLEPIEWIVLIVSLLILLTVSLLQQKGSVREMIDRKVNMANLLRKL